MNWLAIIVLIFMVLHMLFGYVRGLMRMIYSLAAGIVLVIVVSFVTPYSSDYVYSHTTIGVKIEEGCHQKLREAVKNMGKSEKNGKSHENEELLGALFKNLGVDLPEAALRQLLNSVESIDESMELNASADKMLEKTGVYTELSKKVAKMTVTAITYICIFMIGWMASRIFFVFLKVVDHLPIISTVNHLAGMGVGIINGLLLIWIVFAVIAMAVSSSVGQTLIADIYECPPLKWIYENNPILTLILKFLKLV